MANLATVASGGHLQGGRGRSACSGATARPGIPDLGSLGSRPEGRARLAAVAGGESTWWPARSARAPCLLYGTAGTVRVPQALHAHGRRNLGLQRARAASRCTPPPRSSSTRREYWAWLLQASGPATSAPPLYLEQCLAGTSDVPTIDKLGERERFGRFFGLIARTVFSTRLFTLRLKLVRSQPRPWGCAGARPSPCCRASS